MKEKGIYIYKVILFFLVIIITFAGCGDKQINSKWRTQDITIDGNDADWGNSLVFYDDINSLVGVQNDQDYLYLCLVTTDQQLERRIIRTGLTIWFDNTGKGDKKFGIRFPLLMKNMNNSSFASGEDNGEGSRRDPDDGHEGPGGFSTAGGPGEGFASGNMSLKNQTEVEILNSKNEATRTPISDLKGTQLKMTVKDYRMVYEFKIPIAMKSGFSYAVGANAGSTVSVGLETGMNEVRKIKNPINDNANGEGNGEQANGEGKEGGDDNGAGIYGGTGRGRGRRGEQGAYNRGSMDVVDFWADIKLSSANN